MEEWRDIKGYEGYYQISNWGRVKSLKRTVWDSRGCYRKVAERILKAGDNGHGYLFVELCKDGKDKAYRINRLVAQAFLPNPDNLPEVNHKDEDKTNNKVENLEWCSKLYNINYGTGRKRSAEKRAKKAGKKTAEKLRGRKQTEEHIKKRSKPVFSVDKKSGLIMWWQSATEASRQLGISQGNICECCSGKRKSAGGHIWFYAD